MSKNKKQQKQQECQRCAEYLSLAQRARADYANLKKDIEKDRSEFVKFANESLILELVPIFDNFREAMLHIPDEQKTADWVIGIEQIKKQMNDFLKNLGVEIYGKEGEQFDPNLYEALDEVKQEAVEANKIVKLVKVGYKLHGKVIKPGQVIVAK
ncbi:MAG: nucleotide exchange factor GrpE [Candidatus Jacksonbacteria bacterium]